MDYYLEYSKRWNQSLKFIKFQNLILCYRIVKISDRIHIHKIKKKNYKHLIEKISTYNLFYI